MGVFVVDADVLARARFGTSQLVETVAALGLLAWVTPMPWEQAWCARHRPAFTDYLADDPVAAALVAHAHSSTWMADFLTVPPRRPDQTLDEELLYLERLSDEQVRVDLAQVRTPLPDVLAGTGLAAHAAALLRWVWNSAVGPEWPRRERVLRADVVARTARLSREGWSGLLEDMRPGTRWLGDGQLRVNQHPNPPRDIRGGDLMFIAAHCHGGWVCWHLPDRFALVYPVTGVFAESELHAPDALVRLLGAARAQVLVRSADPVSTSALSALTGMPIGTVGDHLRVLLEAGLLHRRRSGREVLYWWSEAGGELVTAAAN